MLANCKKDLVDFLQQVVYSYDIESKLYLYLFRFDPSLSSLLPLRCTHSLIHTYTGPFDTV